MIVRLLQSAAPSAAEASAGEGFVAPGVGNFYLPPLWHGAPEWLTKPVALVAISVLLIALFFVISARRASVVPGRLQFAGEAVYGFVRNSIARDTIGGHDFKPFVPLLFTLFSFIALNNLFGIIWMAQYPTMARIAFPAVLAIVVMLVFNIVGIKRHGGWGYVKRSLFPPGLPPAIYIIVAPIELATLLITRPLTLALRLFANMFAGHMLIMLAMFGGWYMLFDGTGALPFLSPVVFAGAIVLTFFELFIELVQAYVFTLLTAVYIAGALAEEH